MSMTEETKTKVESGGETSDVENGNCSSSGSGGDTKKTCVDCGTSRTPLWRGGPAGPKSLCNACGIKSRKKRQAATGIRQEDTKIKIKIKSKTSCNSLALENRKMSGIVKNKTKTDSDSCNEDKNKKKVKRSGNRFLDLGFKAPAMKRSVVQSRLWRKLGEEERAAVLLMALSCG